MAESTLIRRAESLLEHHPLIDGHNDLAWALRLLSGYDTERTDPAGPLEGTHTDLPRLRRGRVGAQFWSTYVPSTLPDGEAVLAHLEQVDFVHRMVASNPGVLGLAGSVEEVEAVFASGRVASLLEPRAANPSATPWGSCARSTPSGSAT